MFTDWQNILSIEMNLWFLEIFIFLFLSGGVDGEEPSQGTLTQSLTLVVQFLANNWMIITTNKLYQHGVYSSPITSVETIIMGLSRGQLLIKITSKDQETSFYCTKFWPAINFIVIIFYPSQLESQCCSEDDVHSTWVAAAEPSQCQWHINTNSSLAIKPRRQSYLPCFVILFPFINKRIRYLRNNFFLFSSCSWLMSAFNMVAEHSARQS